MVSYYPTLYNFGSHYSTPNHPMDFRTRYRYHPQLDLLGTGGFARVYRASDTLLNRTVALKIFAGTQGKPGSVLDEIRRAIQWEHPNLCRYYDVVLLQNQNALGETETTEVGVMEYLDGGDLARAWPEASEPLRRKLLADVLTGLSYLHQRGTVQRDLKPANILLKTDQHPDGLITKGHLPVAKITDFGISKVLDYSGQPSLLMGTPEYMAPEQFDAARFGVDGKIGTPVDLWSFGVLVYRLVSGRSLFNLPAGADMSQHMHAIFTHDFNRQLARLPEPYRQITERCLVRPVASRVQLAEDLLHLLMSQIGPKPPIPPPPPRRPWIAVLVVGVVIGIGLLIRSLLVPPPPAPVIPIPKPVQRQPNADSLFAAAKQQFEQGVDKQEVIRQFRQAVDWKPALKDSVYPLLTRKAQQFRVLGDSQQARVYDSFATEFAR